MLDGKVYQTLGDGKVKVAAFLELAFDSAQAEFEITKDFDMYRPKNSEFPGMELTKDVSNAIKIVEINEEY